MFLAPFSTGEFQITPSEVMDLAETSYARLMTGPGAVPAMRNAAADLGLIPATFSQAASNL